MLRVDFVSLFPETVLRAARHSILKRAEQDGLVSFNAVDPRRFARDKHRTVDEKPYGGGPGMLMKPETLYDAFLSLDVKPEDAVIVPDPIGRLFRQEDARALSKRKRLVLICGHYEGIDDRLVEKIATHRFSIGDYVLTGGELPALVIADSVVRLLPGVLGCAESTEIDSHSDGLLSAPQYTRPEVFEDMEVPAVLKSGDHGAIETWKRRRSLHLTRQCRPDLFCKAKLARKDLDLLSS